MLKNIRKMQGRSVSLVLFFMAVARALYRSGRYFHVASLCHMTAGLSASKLEPTRENTSNTSALILSASRLLCFRDKMNLTTNIHPRQ
jgi:hypothetical protein